MGHILEHVAIELQAIAGHQVSFGKTRGADLPGLYHVVFEYEQQTVGLEAAAFAMRLLRSLLPPELAADMHVDNADEPFNFAEERDSFIRFAQRRNLGTQHDVAGARGRGAGHPVDPAQRPEPDPVRSRPVPAANPGHRHQPHVQHRGRARLRQGGDQQDPRQPGPAGAAAAPGPARDRCGVGGIPHRVSGGGEAVQWQPWARGVHQPRRCRAGHRRLPRGAGDQPQRHRREVHRGPRPSHAGGERPAHRRLEADAGPCGGRRRAHDRATGGRSEPRSAPRHRAREGAHPDRLRLPGRAPARGAWLQPRFHP